MRGLTPGHSALRERFARESIPLLIGPRPAAIPSRIERDAKTAKPCYHSLMSTQRIKSDPKVMYGKPVIAGTRITVEHILRCLAAGETPDSIVADDPPLTLDDIRAAQAFAADHLAREAVFAAE